MARNDETESPKRKRKGASVMVWLLMAMLVTGLGGYGVTNYGGRVAAIGSVGGRDIDVKDYGRALQAEMNALGAQAGTQLTMQQARDMGIDARVRQQLVTQTAVDDAADRIGVSVGDARVAQDITAMPSFHGAAGGFDRQTYKMTLDRNNLTEAEFEAKIRDDLARALVQGAVTGGFVAPAAVTDTLYNFIGERRGFSLLVLSEADLATPLAAPTDADLKAFYDANVAAFTKPEAKRITYVSLLPEKLAATMPVDDAELKKLYDQHHDEYVKPERRLVERLVFGTEDEAKAAKARLDAGESFEKLVEERGLKLIDIDLGDVTQAELGAAGADIFAMPEPGVIGPLPSDLGPALYRMNAVLAAQETSFDDAREMLTLDYQTDAARRAITDRSEAINDALAGGATLEDLAREQAMDLGTIDYAAGSDEGIAAYPAFREAADAANAGDFPETVALEDGGLVALRLDEIVPASPIPFDEAREGVTQAWRAEALHKALLAEAEAMREKVTAGTSIGTLGVVSVTPEIARNGFVEGAPPSLLPAVFAMPEGEAKVIEDKGFVALVQLDRVAPAEQEGEGPAALKGAIAAQAEQALAQDAFALFARAEADIGGITLNQAAIDAVHAQMR